MNYEHMGKSQDAMSWLNYWITERERIRQVKQVEGPTYNRPAPKPWSDDLIFQTTYFCNVRREDDKVTRWIRQNWTPEVIGWEEYDYAMVIARMLNNIPCLEAISLGLTLSQKWKDLGWLQWALEERATQGLQVWGGAYLVSTHGLAMGKAAYLCKRVLPSAYEALAGSNWRTRYGSSPLTLARHHGALMQLEGLGSFMAAQVIADLKNTPEHPLEDAYDWGSFCAPGPGSLRGIKWVMPTARPGDFLANILWIASELNDDNQEQLLQNPKRVINMQDLQNCLCEFDKFMRVMTKTGKSKRKYDGT